MASTIKQSVPTVSQIALAVSLALGAMTVQANDPAPAPQENAPSAAVVPPTAPAPTAIAVPPPVNANPVATKAPEKITITGSSIKRIEAETALPVQVITSDDIKKSGFSSVTDLIQNLPVMQGFTTNSQSVNGGGGGATTASIHDIGSSYTLVLLNGRRIAPLNTGSTVNLNSIPLAAIERVEVLTDGASALYGSDAIAGVVNFITKKDTTDGFVTATGNIPQHDGGGSYTVSASKGFGDLDKDKFNILVSASYDKQQALAATQRSFSKTGDLYFYDRQGRLIHDPVLSYNSAPGNIGVAIADANQDFAWVNKYYLDHGKCPKGEIAVTDSYGTVCKYDYPAQVQLVPASERTSLFTTGRLNISDSNSLFTEIGYSRFFNEPTYAPPAQQNIALTPTQIANDVNPYLAKIGYAGQSVDPNNSAYYLRLADAGGRQDKYETDVIHFVIGDDFTVSDIDFTAAYTHSQNRFKDTALGGYSSFSGFENLLSSGTWDPLATTSVPGASASILAPIVLHQVLDESKSTLDILKLNGSTPIGKLDGGDIGLGFGADYTKQGYQDTPSAILQGANKMQPHFSDSILGGGGGALPYDSTRNSFGAFSELALPFTKELELSAAARFDSYGKVSNSEVFADDTTPLGSRTQGKDASSGTYKLGLKYKAFDSLLLRGSIGTGFKAPALGDISSPLTSGGSTGQHPCPFQPTDAQFYYCGGKSGTQEWNIATIGNPASDESGLKPEKSTQWTFGFRYEPSAAFGFQADFWAVNIRDQIGSISEAAAFGDGSKTTAYPNLFRFVPDPITGVKALTFLEISQNLGKAAYKGIDVEVNGQTNTPLGKLTDSVKATYMIQDSYQLPGSPGYFTSLGQIGADGHVTFRWLLDAVVSLQAGKFVHTVSASVKPGYKDDWSDYTELGIGVGDWNAPNRRVGSYTLFNWQTKYDFTEALSLTGGILNVFDRQPPFSIIDQGGTGNARGFDGRYTDPIGRQFYLTCNYKF